ncbi:MAG: DUF2125 domain-containing protein, partial [Gemmatimonadaceae bacterium]|nr:DUF2125 domain-containing protein [Acetobacteraceae bacterium]
MALFVAIGHSAFWFRSSGRIAERLQAHAAQLRENGWAVSAGSISRRGWPWTAEASSGPITVMRAGLSWRVDTVTAAAGPHGTLVIRPSGAPALVTIREAAGEVEVSGTDVAIMGGSARSGTLILGRAGFELALATVTIGNSPV